MSETFFVYVNYSPGALILPSPALNVSNTEKKNIKWYNYTIKTEENSFLNLLLNVTGNAFYVWILIFF